VIQAEEFCWLSDCNEVWSALQPLSSIFHDILVIAHELFWIEVAICVCNDMYRIHTSLLSEPLLVEAAHARCPQVGT